MISLKPYEEMSCNEIILYWARLNVKAPNGYTIFRSPNKVLWAIVDEVKNRTLEMWDVNTGYVYHSSLEALK